LGYEIKLGYEVGTGNEIKIPPSHLIVTGVTQRSGKTTCMQSLIKRSGKRAIVFTTKIGEAGFTEGTIIQPFFLEESKWQYVESLFSALMNEKFKFERSWIIEVCRDTKNLTQVKKNIDAKLNNQRLNQMSKSVYTTLSAYFDIILPQLSKATFSKKLELHEGINIMDLEDYKDEMQSLVIRSVLETILREFKDTIVVIPEAWKFVPQGKGNPCKSAVESYIRQGATNGNYLWIDSQDMARIDKSILKQASTWILGLQTERNEVEHTLDQISLPRADKPSADMIMTLKIGHFYAVTPSCTKLTYVQPLWIDDATAIKVAMGKVKVEDLIKPKSTIQYLNHREKLEPKPEIKTETPPAIKQIIEKTDAKTTVETNSHLILNRLKESEGVIQKLKEENERLRKSQSIDVDAIIKKIQLNQSPDTLKQEIVNEIMKKMPALIQSQTHPVTPVEKIYMFFLNDAKDKLIGEINRLNRNEKKVLKYIEMKNTSVTITEVNDKCLMRQGIWGMFGKLNSLQLARYDMQKKVCMPNLKTRIRLMLKDYKPTEKDIEQVYNYIIVELLK
jgi:hypothetical protein